MRTVKLDLRTSDRTQMVSITHDVQAQVTAAGIDTGVCHVFVP